MLKEIRCSEFNQKIIKFNDGLNVVLGDELASNSIGKTTMLMIIDFVFGGSSYIICKQDAINSVGDHEFNFKFEFSNKYYYYCRTTKNYKFVYICDENYNKVEEIGLNEYKKMIQQKYKLDYLGTHFRSIVGNYSRIWGKDNYNVDKPLKQKDSKVDDSIKDLIRLFNRYNSIENMELQLLKVKGKKDAISKAVKNKLIPSINKTQYNKNIKEIDDLNRKIEKFKNDMNDKDLNLDSLVSNEVFELREEKNQLYAKKNLLLNRIKRIESNLNSEDLKVNAKMNRLVEFFPNINIEKLQKINDFHKDMSNSLKKELKSEMENLNAVLELINKDIVLVEKNIDDILDYKDIPKYNIERLADLLTRKNKLEEINKYYEDTQKNNEEVNNIKKDLKVIKAQIISDIANTINIEMFKLFAIIYSDGRKSPTFSINDESYSLKRENDTGTGSSYINLIGFDIAIFSKTELPFIIHDSILFKNIELNAFENLLNIYLRFQRQIFISIDEINRFSNETQQILNENAIICLGKEKTLFIKNWKIDN